MVKTLPTDSEFKNGKILKNSVSRRTVQWRIDAKDLEKSRNQTKSSLLGTP